MNIAFTLFGTRKHEMDLNLDEDCLPCRSASHALHHSSCNQLQYTKTWAGWSVVLGSDKDFVVSA